MSQDDIHESLESSRIAAEELVSEMGRYKTASELREAESTSLSQINDALGETLERIRPYREDKTRRFRLLLLGGTALNSLLLILLLLILILRN